MTSRTTDFANGPNGVPSGVVRARRWLSPESLALTGVLSAFTLSTWNTFFTDGTGEVYFETATMVLVLVTFGRRCATQAMAAAARLDEDQRSTMVACVFEHDGAVVGEGPMPWAQVAIDVQAARHLPAHVEQLENLRA